MKIKQYVLTMVGLTMFFAQGMNAQEEMNEKFLVFSKFTSLRDNFKSEQWQKETLNSENFISIYKEAKNNLNELIKNPYLQGEGIQKELGDLQKTLSNQAMLYIGKNIANLKSDLHLKSSLSLNTILEKTTPWINEVFKEMPEEIASTVKFVRTSLQTTFHNLVRAAIENFYKKFIGVNSLEQFYAIARISEKELNQIIEKMQNTNLNPDKFETTINLFEAGASLLLQAKQKIEQGSIVTQEDFNNLEQILNQYPGTKTPTPTKKEIQQEETPEKTAQSAVNQEEFNTEMKHLSSMFTELATKKHTVISLMEIINNLNFAFQNFYPEVIQEFEKKVRAAKPYGIEEEIEQTLKETGAETLTKLDGVKNLQKLYEITEIPAEYFDQTLGFMQQSGFASQFPKLEEFFEYFPVTLFKIKEKLEKGEVITREFIESVSPEALSKAETSQTSEPTIKTIEKPFNPNLLQKPSVPSRRLRRPPNPNLPPNPNKRMPYRKNQ